VIIDEAPIKATKLGLAAVDAAAHVTNTHQPFPREPWSHFRIFAERGLVNAGPERRREAGYRGGARSAETSTTRQRRHARGRSLSHQRSRQRYIGETATMDGGKRVGERLYGCINYSVTFPFLLEMTSAPMEDRGIPLRKGATQTSLRRCHAAE